MNKDLILREKLAIERTELANQSTFLAFIRTSLYFFVAAISIANIFKETRSSIIITILYLLSSIILSSGIINFFNHKKRIKKAKESIGKIKDEYIVFK